MNNCCTMDFIPLSVSQIKEAETIDDKIIDDIKTKFLSKEAFYLKSVFAVLFDMADTISTAIQESGLTKEELSEKYIHLYPAITNAKFNYVANVGYCGNKLVYKPFTWMNNCIDEILNAPDDADRQRKLNEFAIELSYKDVTNVPTLLRLSLVAFATSKVRRIPFISFDDFYNLVTEPRNYIKQVFDMSQDDMCADKFVSAELKSGYIVDLSNASKTFIVSRYIDFMSTMIEYEGVKDILQLAYDFVGYLVDDEDVEYTIIETLQAIPDGNPTLTEDTPEAFSDEAINGTNFTLTKTNAGTLQGARLEDMNNKYKSKSLSMKKTFIKVFKIGPITRKMNKHAKFFKKYFGRIPSLYEKYANEAEVYENKMKGDPAQILSSTAIKYIENLTLFADSLFGEITGTAKKLLSTNDSIQRIGVVKSYCKHYPIENQDDPKEIQTQIENETYFRIAQALFKGISIYGYSVEGIVQNKKFPPANHIVTSMFVDNPNEVPGKISVSQVFSNPNSLLVFSKPENFQKFTNLYSTASTKIIGSFNDAAISGAVKQLDDFADKTCYNIKQGNATSGAENADPALQKKVVKAIEKGLTTAIDLAVEQKQRVLQCAEVAYEMVERVSRTAQLCVVAMLNVERSHTDSGYDSNLANGKNRAINKQLQRNTEHVEGKSEKEKLQHKYHFFET